MRPYTLKMGIFDWGGRLHRTRAGSENFGHYQPSNLGLKLFFRYLFLSAVLRVASRR